MQFYCVCAGVNSIITAFKIAGVVPVSAHTLKKHPLWIRVEPSGEAHALSRPCNRTPNC